MNTLTTHIGRSVVSHHILTQHAATIPNEHVG
jgi:hypothetical protein